MAKAFLSHSSKDKDIVRRIAAQLGNKNCVLDEISFEPSARALDEIFKSLESSDVFVLFISDASLSSKWVKKEINKAKENFSKDIIERIVPIIIDVNITHLDDRIPKWIAKPYNLKYISNEVVILKKIRQALKEINFKRTNFNQELENKFVGRNDEMNRFENDINNVDSWTPTYIVAYNYFEGIGRRTFLKNALRKYDLIDYLDSPITVSIDAKESIENFIYKLHAVGKDQEIAEYDFSVLDIEAKIEIAVALVKQFLEYKELLFIVDDGGIILPNNKIVDWFTKIVNHKFFDNNLVFCLVSKYRPNEVFLKKEKKALVYRVPELSRSDTRNLFLTLLRVYKLDGINREDKEFFISHLNGIPSQIIYAINLIQISLFDAKRNIEEVVEYSDRFSNTIVNHLKETNPLAYQLIILLSTNEIFSLDFIEKVFGQNSATSSALQKLYDLSLFNFVFGGYEYIKLNPTLTDYVNRSKISLDEQFRVQYSIVTKQLLAEDLDKIIAKDYSEFMITLQNMLEEGVTIPKKFFIPSLIIKNVIKEYDKGNYALVIKICLGLLENQKYDPQIIWETKYRLTLAYARTKDSNFFDHISYFNSAESMLDYYFLLGFYYRNKGNQSKALEYYYKVLEVFADHSRTKREIVNILLSQGKYEDALQMAKENYEKRRTNIYHIHSYFLCLIRKTTNLTQGVLSIILTLMNSVRSSPDIKSQDILRCMTGDYEFYVNGNFEKANDILLEAIVLNQNKSYPKKLLAEIYRKKGINDAIDDLNSIDEIEDEDID
jgi:tetratricopeptide (TPR) repeat protein